MKGGERDEHRKPWASGYTCLANACASCTASSSVFINPSNCCCSCSGVDAAAPPNAARIASACVASALASVFFALAYSASCSVAT